VLTEALAAIASLAVLYVLGRRARAIRARRRLVMRPQGHRRPPGRVHWPAVVDAIEHRPLWQVALVGGVVASTGGLLVGGPVAGFVAAAYGVVGLRTLSRRRARRDRGRARATLLDRLAGMAADLRAGLPLSTTAPISPADPGSERLVRLTAAAAGLAEKTGAPLADLVERIEADARSADRAKATADAEAAGARATAVLLAGLPVGGIALGFGIGVDPVAVLLHTPIGAACAVAAVVLQLLGLAWTAHLAAGPA
jgi:tight adherence protein B